MYFEIKMQITIEEYFVSSNNERVKKKIKKNQYFILITVIHPGTFFFYWFEIKTPSNKWRINNFETNHKKPSNDWSKCKLMSSPIWNKHILKYEHQNWTIGCREFSGLVRKIIYAAEKHGIFSLSRNWHIHANFSMFQHFFYWELIFCEILIQNEFLTRPNYRGDHCFLAIFL